MAFHVRFLAFETVSWVYSWYIPRSRVNCLEILCPWLPLSARFAHSFPSLSLSMPRRGHVFQLRRMLFIQHVLPIHFSGTLPTVFLLEPKMSPVMVGDARSVCHLSWMDERKVRRYEPCVITEMMLNQMRGSLYVPESGLASEGDLESPRSAQTGTRCFQSLLFRCPPVYR